MRVTNNMLINNMMRNLNNNLRRVDKYQNQLSTGKRIHVPSDDPVRASRALKLRTDLSKLEQYARNAENAMSWIEISESAVGEVGDILQRARELTVRAANGSLGTDDKQKIADEMKQLRKQLISAGNTNYAGRYIFSGYETDKSLFDKDGNFNIDITSSILNNKPTTEVEISIGESIQVSTNGLDIFGFEEINPILQKLTFGQDIGEAATRAELKGTQSFDLEADFTGIANDSAVRITIDGTTYTAQLSTLDGTQTKEDVITLLSNADDGVGNKLGDVADIYFDIEGKLGITSNSYGAASSVEVNLIPDSMGGLDLAEMETAFGIVDGTFENGINVGVASVNGTEALLPGEITNEAFEGTELIVELNGVQKKITLGSFAPDDHVGLIGSINTALDSEFGLNKIEAYYDSTDNTVNFYTLNSNNDGTKPELKIDVVRAKKSTMLEDFEAAIDAMNNGDKDKINEFLGKLDNHINRVLSVRSDIGARVNRLELVQDRIEENNLTYSKLLSQNEDADMAEVIMRLKNEENVYRASLSTGARVIQPTLIDFIR